ncbi:MAG: TnpV protein [Clostridia bacterium]|nr:TnpV protein [Clostridia bacterium]
MKELEKYITDEKTGLKYELVGDYYFLAGDEEPEEHRPIGIWGQRHLQYLRRYKKATYMALQIEDKLPDYLADINEQAEEMLFQLVKQMAKDEGVDEVLKRHDQLGWVQRMNSIRNRAEEVVLNEIIYN